MKGKIRFADLHCHPGELIYHKLRGDTERLEFTADRNNNPTRLDAIKESCSKLLKGKMAGPYLQSDFFKSSLSRHSLLFVALYPLEMGFATGEFRTGRFLSTLLSNIPFLNSIMFTLNIKKLNVGRRKYLYIRSGDYDYYDELEAVYAYYNNKNGEVFNGETFVDRCKKGPTKGRYKIIQTKQDVVEMLNPAPQSTIGVIFTVEGLHAFGTGHIKKSKDKDVDEATFLARIEDWKKRDLPIFFITFSHHFNNKLCGHAHSFPNIVGNLVLAQEENLAAGFTELGREAMNLLLNLGKYATGNHGRRILIDVKHMSPSGRKEYYQVIKTHNVQNPDDVIPIIASHMGFTGRQLLDDIIYLNKEGKPDARQTRKKEKDRLSEPGFMISGKTYHFSPWGINLCGEDVREIVRSKGLIGLSMDERILSAKKTRKWISRKRWSVEKKRELFIGIVLNNILGVLDAVYNNPSDLTEEEKSHVADCLCLGSDFDGYINPLDAYSAVSMYEDLCEDLVKAIQQYNEKNQDSPLSKFINPATDLQQITNWVDKFAFKNAYDFVLQQWEKLESKGPFFV